MANFFRSILLRLQNKSVTAGTSDTSVSADSGYDGLGTVTITPQQHSETYTPSANTAANDMGAVHNKRYVNTSGMIVPSGNKAITSNGTGIDVSSYSTASVSVTPSLQSKSAAPNVSTNKPVTPDSGYDGLSQVTITPLSHTGYSPSSSTYTSLAMGESKSIDLGANHDKRYVRVQAAAPSGNKSITANGTGIDVASYSTVSVAVPHPTHTTTYTPAANKSNNDMGATHSYRYVNTSGMITPSGNKAISANGTGIDVAGYSTVSVAVPDPTLSGDAAKANVLSGKTFYNTSTTKQTGTMTNNGAVSKTLSASERSYTVPAGYHNGSGSVTVPAVTATKRVGSTSTSVDVASDDWTVSLNCGDRLYLSKGVIADGYSQGAVAAASLSSQTGVDSGKTAIDASHVHSGYQGWVNGNKISGTYTAPTITDITPSDSSPVALATTGNYHPTSAGYAIASNLTALAPSNSNPAPIYASKVYKPTDSGYAIGVYEEKTPSTSGASFSAGMVKMSSAGYAYSEKPTKTTTTLWTNSSPTSSFAQKDLTGLSSGISNFDYIKITYRWGKSDATSQSTIFASDEFPNSNGRVTIGMRVGNTTRLRPIYKSSNTSIYFYGSYQTVTSSQSASADYIIPTKIEGIKYNGIS